MEKDENKAFQLYLQSHEGGYPAGTCSLGLCYELGQGVEQDLAKAVELYRQAADQGSVQAQCNLGYCYYQGIGVEEDDAQAAAWFEKSAQQGHAVPEHGPQPAEGHHVPGPLAVPLPVQEPR